MSINGLNPLAYVGVNSPNPAAQIISMNSDPTVNDSQNFTIGDIWINRNTLIANAQRIFMLTALIGNQATWTEIAAEANVINVLGGDNITVNTVDGDATVNLDDDVTIGGSFVAGGSVTADGNVASGLQLFTLGDSGVGIGGTTSFTNGNTPNVPGGGALTISSQSANPGLNAGFIKIYVGSTVAFIPYYTNIAP